jgi:hypothetical protein
MKILRRCLLILLATWLLMFANHLSWQYPPLDYFKNWLFYIFPFFVVAVGLIQGWFGVMIIQHSRWIKSFYLFGLNTAGLALIILLLWAHARIWARALYSITHPTARYTFYNHWGLTTHNTARGFDRISAAFPEPRQVHYLGCEITGRDSLIKEMLRNYLQDTVPF